MSLATAVITKLAIDGSAIPYSELMALNGVPNDRPVEMQFVKDSESGLEEYRFYWERDEPQPQAEPELPDGDD